MVSTPSGWKGLPVQRTGTIPVRLPEPSTVARVVAVMSDGSGLRRSEPVSAPESVAALLSDDAALIRELAGVPVLTLLVAARDADHLLAALPPDTGAVFLTHTAPLRARALQQALREAGGPPVVTDQDTSAITLTASLLTTLARAGRTPGDSRVVIAGADGMPHLCPLLMAAGFADISSWTQADAQDFPLHRIARDATAVIDLAGGAAAQTLSAADRQGPIVIRPAHPAYRLLPVPGLLRAVLTHPQPRIDVDLHCACALALVAATPSSRSLPREKDRLVADQVASVALDVLNRRAPWG